MSEKTEITFMQTRLIRLASEEWHLPVEQIIHLFKEADVLGYIEKCYGIFHCEGDEAVLEDITEFLQRKGIETSAWVKRWLCSLSWLHCIAAHRKKKWIIQLTFLSLWWQMRLQKKRARTETLTDFLCSKTGKALYDEKTKLWCNGPAYIAELYREELKKSGYQIWDECIFGWWSRFCGTETEWLVICAGHTGNQIREDRKERILTIRAAVSRPFTYVNIRLSLLRNQ